MEASLIVVISGLCTLSVIAAVVCVDEEVSVLESGYVVPEAELDGVAVLSPIVVSVLVPEDVTPGSELYGVVVPLIVVSVLESEDVVPGTGLDGVTVSSLVVSVLVSE